MIAGVWGGNDAKSGDGRVKSGGAGAGAGAAVVVAPASRAPDEPRLGRAESISRVRGSRPIPLDQLKNIVRGMTAESILPEFNKLRLNRPPPELLPVACRSLVANVAVFPFPHTRVGVGKDKFINASYIRGADGFPSRYIATQAPVVPGSMADKLPTVAVFWEMVLEHLCPAVVLLDTSGAPFWPLEVGEVQVHGAGGVSVTSRAVTSSGSHTAIALELQSVDMGTHKVMLFVLDRWNDDLPALVALSTAVRLVAKSNLGAPVVCVVPPPLPLCHVRLDCHHDRWCELRALLGCLQSIFLWPYFV